MGSHPKQFRWAWLWTVHFWVPKKENSDGSTSSTISRWKISNIFVSIEEIGQSSHFWPSAPIFGKIALSVSSSEYMGDLFLFLPHGRLLYLCVERNDPVSYRSNLRAAIPSCEWKRYTRTSWRLWESVFDFKITMDPGLGLMPSQDLVRSFSSILFPHELPPEQRVTRKVF